MEKTKKLNKLKVGIVIFLVVLAFSIAVFGRFIYNMVIDAYFSAKQFYFSSDILLVGEQNASYTYVNWGGIGEYRISVDLYSYNNKLSKVDYDLEYTLTCQSLDERIRCSIDGTNGETSTTGTIFATTNRAVVTILVEPTNTQIQEGETVNLLITASTSEPYKKTIARKISLRINLPSGNTYTIDDEPGREYATLKLVNLSQTATQATLSFDPDELRLDLNDELYTDTNYYVSSETTTDGKYIDEIVFFVDAEAAKNVKFYKVDKTQDYSYPRVGVPSAIEVDY